MKPNDKAIEAAADAISLDTVFDLSKKECFDIAKVALDAAYAAQFPPSEDYAGFVKELRIWGSMNYKICTEAADAIEALLAERKSLTTEVLLSERQNDILTGDIDRLRVERNANIREKGKEDE